jgi:twitching motility two-component system response regulator PilH
MPLMQRLITLIGSNHMFGHEGNDTRGGISRRPPERRANRRMNAREGTRVLIIDDCEIALAELGKLFAAAKYAVSQSQDSERGLFKACFEYPELVILDVGMPGMNGFEVLKRMRRDPLARRIPVILISGNPRVAEHIRQLKIDADGFLRKPFKRLALFKLIESMLDKNLVPQRSQNRPPFQTPAMFRVIRQHLIRH